MLFEKDQKRQLIRQNQDLKRQLEKAKGLITSLYREIEELKQQLIKYEKEKSFKSPETPKMKMEEHFDSSSEEEDKELQNVGDRNGERNGNLSPKVRFKNQDLNLSPSIGRGSNTQLSKASTKVIYNSQEFVPKKSIQKLLKKSSERGKEQDMSYHEKTPKAMSSREIPLALPLFGKDLTSVCSQKSLFKKTSQSRPIFEHFFVTGVGKDGPCIIFNYPTRSGFDFSGYLSLIYGQNYLRFPDLSPCNSKTKININTILREPFALRRQCFVIPIVKANGQSAQRDYLIVCEAEEPVLQKNDKQLGNYLFTRYYCFLSQWKFLCEFRKLTALIMDRLQVRRRQSEPVSEAAFGVEIGKELEQALRFLHQKSTDYNKTIDCCIGELGLRFSADVPPLESSYSLVDKYLQNSLFNTPVYIKIGDEESIETKLHGLLLAYGLAEIKIVLYSVNKAKVSDSVLQFLELIRPLTYVNPVIVSALREEHETYLDAPMGLILGLWSERWRSNKQKIEIFMNKKLNLAGLIEKAKLSITDGIVINLDTGFVFGGALSAQLNSIAVKLNNLAVWNQAQRNIRDYYKFVERMLSGRWESEEVKAVWTELMGYIRKTQMYCYYLENKED